MNVKLDLPATFFNNHEERELVLHSGTQYKTTKAKRVIVELHPRDAADLLSDAEHYHLEDEYPAALRRAAKNCYDAIVAQYPETQVRDGWATAGSCDLVGWCPICGNNK